MQQGIPPGQVTQTVGHRASIGTSAATPSFWKRATSTAGRMGIILGRITTSAVAHHHRMMSTTSPSSLGMRCVGRHHSIGIHAAIPVLSKVATHGAGPAVMRSAGTPSTAVVRHRSKIGQCYLMAVILPHQPLC